MIFPMSGPNLKPWPAESQGFEMSRAPMPLSADILLDRCAGSSRGIWPQVRKSRKPGHALQQSEKQPKAAGSLCRESVQT